MIIVKLMGGLGNQLFQYAFGRSLAIKNNTDLYLDISYFNKKNEKDTPRSFELQHFNINAKIADNSILSKFINNKFDLKNRLICSVLSFNQYKKIKEKHVDFDDSLNQKKGNLYFRGYFQDERYFANFKTIIAQELSYNKSIKKDYQIYLDAITQNKENAVAIHIRKTDFTNAVNKDKFDIVSDDYYLKKVEEYKSINRDIKFFCFSDDIEYCKKLFDKTENIIYIEATKPNSTDEFYLMQTCKQHIIGNSTFAWWAVWLSNNK